MGIGRHVLRWLSPLREALRLRSDVDALYGLLYRIVHDPDHAPDLAGLQTRDAFSHQWATLAEGEAMLSDPWFRDNVARILSEEELCLDPQWFRGKDVLDCGCGGGRWSYGLAKLGANVTAVDVNDSALAQTRQALAGLPVEQSFVRSPLEEVSQHLPAGKKYDLVFSWGVLHHCGSFTRALQEIAGLVKPAGVLYLYLYGRESLSFAADVALFRERVRYNALADWPARRDFLLRKTRGDESKLHQAHDMFAPLINRRFTWDEVRVRLEALGFASVVRTIDYTEVFARASRTPLDERWTLLPKRPPYWFERYRD
jgi:SAM-dependent methyltransferase